MIEKMAERQACWNPFHFYTCTRERSSRSLSGMTRRLIEHKMQIMISRLLTYFNTRFNYNQKIINPKTLVNFGNDVVMVR